VINEAIDRIFIKGLTLDASIGIYPIEMLKKQRLIIDLEMSVNTRVSAQSGLINDTVDYDLVARSAAEIVNQHHYHLLETLADEITSMILTQFKVRKVVCTLYKPDALKNAQTVGVTIERTV
jgi:7,8-dihydroneopterin aldolase/epimerase/oxygenase